MTICRECYSSNIEKTSVTNHPIWGEMMSFWHCKDCDHHFIEHKPEYTESVQAALDRAMKGLEDVPFIIEGRVAYVTLGEPPALTIDELPIIDLGIS